MKGRFGKLSFAFLMLGVPLLTTGWFHPPPNPVKARIEIIVGAVAILVAARLLRREIWSAHPTEDYPAD